jgi:methionyl aminopeptidase
MIRLKSARDIAGIRKSCDILSELLRRLMAMAEPGMRTQELDAYAESFIRERGGAPAFLGYMGYPATLCVSINEEVIHGIPGPRKLRSGDILSMDCGVILDGYVSDAAVSVGVGAIDPAAGALMEATRECLRAGIAEAKKGNRIHHIGKSVYALASSRGYGVVHQYCGHGVGFSQHEDPQVPNYPSRGPNPRIVPGMVLAIEPMINEGTGDVNLLPDDWTVVTADGKRSAHFEHTVAILPDRTEVLTTWDL